MSTQPEIEASYSVDNEFFKLWLDEEMNYTCGLFLSEGESLEQSQQNKLQFLTSLAHIHEQTDSVLDVGCGWGACLAYQANVSQVPDVHGITLSTAQYAYCANRNLQGVTVSCEDYRDYKPPRAFDAIICICMMEHIARPQQCHTGEHIEAYRDFFRRMHTWSNSGSYMALQAITTNVLPRKKADLEDMRFANEVVFPGGLCPRVEDLIVAVNPYYEVIEMYSRRDHYRQTSTHWLKRLQSNRGTILNRWGRQLYDDYERYLYFCVRAFENNYQSLHQFSLRRL
jgi:cyclopropane-fatty-acyl-phospholipid synthase